MFWVLAVFSIAVLLVICFFVLIKRMVIEQRYDSIKERDKKALYSNAEKSFLSVLENAVGPNYIIMGQIRIFDLLAVKCGYSFLADIITRIFSDYRFDYVVLDKSSLKVACAVELEERSRGNNIKQRSRLYLKKLLEVYCVQADLPLLVIQEKSGYDLNELIERFEALADIKTDTAVQNHNADVLAH